MVKHNNILDNSHFRKDWQRRIVTWFDQPAKKVARRNARAEKAKKLAPRPVNKLRPAVRCPTVKYNTRVRAGRGFTLDELRAAGISPKSAPGIGICVDHRRRNRSQESLATNVERLKLYKSKLVVFPRNGFKRSRKGDSSKAACDSVTQVTDKMVLPITQEKKLEAPRKITSEERDANVCATLRKALTDGKLWGAREKRIADKEAADLLKANKKKK